MSILSPISKKEKQNVVAKSMYVQVLTLNKSNCFLLQFLPTSGRADKSSRTQLEDFHTAGCGEELIP